MKLIYILIIAGIGTVSLIVAGSNGDEHMEIRSPVFMPDL